MAWSAARYRKLKWLSLVIAGLLLGLFWATNFNESERFTKTKWDGATPEMRDRLLASLAEDGMLIGMTETQLYELLGEPDGGDWGRSIYFLGKKDVFDGGCQPGFVVQYGTDQTVQGQSLSCLQEGAGDAVFDGEKWRTGSQVDRLAMMRDLIASRHILGRTRHEVHDMLGQPDESTNQLKVWYTRRYLENGIIKKRHAGASRCLYVHFRDGRVEKAAFVGS